MSGARAIALCAAFIVAVLVLRSLVHQEPQDVLVHKKNGDVDTFYGSWHFPRGGPYVLGFMAQAQTKLYVDGKLIVRGEGTRSRRVLYQAGDYRVRIETAGTFKLLWHPPGRRGPLEYVPASSLSPSEDSPAFRHPGTSLLDGLFALSIFLAMLLCIAYLARDTIRTCDRRIWQGFVLVFLGALLIRMIGLGDQGQTWDEDVNWSAGRNYISNLLCLDFSDASWRWNYQHPPVMKYLAGLGAQFSDSYGPSRSISALLGSSACALLVPIGVRLFRFRVGILAGLLAALSPHIIAHSQVVGHEAPSMFFWSLAIYLSLRAHDECIRAPMDRWRFHKRLVALGIVLGLAVFSRYINGLLAPLVGMILLLQAPKAQRKKTLALGLTVLPLVALLTCIAVWPRLWSDPVLHMQESWLKLKQSHGAEPYLGVLTTSPGRSYFFLYLWATAPLGVLLFAKVWLLRVVAWREKASLILILWLLVPMVVTLSPVRQDGVRYIMPALLAMSLAAAAGVDFVVRQRLHRYTFPLLGGILAAYLMVVCLRIRPFYLDYYGEQVGGPSQVAADKRFEIAWWGEGMNEALDYVNRHASLGARVYKRCFEPGHLAWLRGDLWPYEANRPAQASWFLVYQPSIRRCSLPSDAALVFEVKAQGATLAQVYFRERRSPPRPGTEAQ